MNSNINDLLLKVQDLINNKKYNEAKNIIENKILNLDNQCDKAYYFLSEIEYFLGNVNESISALDIILGFKQCELDKSYIYFVKGRLYSEELQNYKCAIENYSKAIKLNPNIAKIYFYRGYVKQTLNFENGVNYGNVDLSSIEDFSKAIELSPNESKSYSYRGGLYHILKKYSLALEDMNKYIELEPNDPMGYCNRAYIKSDIEDFEGAIIDYTKSINLLGGEDSSIYFSRGIAKCALKDYQGAKDDYKTGMKIANNEESYLSNELKSKISNL